ncbi:hypothetical protein I79_001315 [Cricetulus griseus]|uniref:Uncharacterized protein n=1 Tax=Cricetulus griseus TaxID=10029 RepID=G3GUF6_CRIGR|nr:hypothetical protein I79_001315 [Cricetulus griseus]
MFEKPYWGNQGMKKWHTEEATHPEAGTRWAMLTLREGTYSAAWKLCVFHRYSI